MASIVEWESLTMQGYRYRVLAGIARMFEIFGVRRPLRYYPVPASPGTYEDAARIDRPDAPSILEKYLEQKPSNPAQEIELTHAAPQEQTPDALVLDQEPEDITKDKLSAVAPSGEADHQTPDQGDGSNPTSEDEETEPSPQEPTRD
jgi:hypothetical protein